MKAKALFLIVYFALFVQLVYGTAQVPDLLIYKGDTLYLFANPLEDYYNAQNPRPDNFGFTNCRSTACWRGYIAEWEICDSTLFLKNILDCCFWKDYEFSTQTFEKLKEKGVPNRIIKKFKHYNRQVFQSSIIENVLAEILRKKDLEKYKQIILDCVKKERQKADLKKLFPNHFKNNRVEAFWFSGELKVPQGNEIEYVHMGYGSVYERDMVFTLEAGKLKEITIYDNTAKRNLKDVSSLNAGYFSLVLPKQLTNNQIENYRTFKDSVEIYNEDHTLSLVANAQFSKNRLNATERIARINFLLDSCKSANSKTYTFGEVKFAKHRTGYLAWIDGTNVYNDGFTRLIVMANFNSQVIVGYKERFTKKERFTENANLLTEYIEMMEFGY